MTLSIALSDTLVPFSRIRQHSSKTVLEFENVVVPFMRRNLREAYPSVYSARSDNALNFTVQSFPPAPTLDMTLSQYLASTPHAVIIVTPDSTTPSLADALVSITREVLSRMKNVEKKELELKKRDKAAEITRKLLDDVTRTEQDKLSEKLRVEVEKVAMLETENAKLREEISSLRNALASMSINTAEEDSFQEDAHEDYGQETEKREETSSVRSTLASMSTNNGEEDSIKAAVEDEDEDYQQKTENGKFKEEISPVRSALASTSTNIAEDSIKAANEDEDDDYQQEKEEQRPKRISMPAETVWKFFCSNSHSR
ncbi:hypothetical protein HK102_002213 [Quaeritorhiza haematococci]|nr:hypothetical protein HK102_002213 [Quaeritorhiza haematococci]